MPAQFLTDSALNAALERILREAEEQLILISPFIKLHDRLQALLKQRLNDDKLGLAMPSRGASISRNGRSYYFWETTNTGFRLGEIHPDCSDLSQWSIVDL